MQKKDFKLILNHQGKLYQIHSNHHQISKKQNKNFFYYNLQPIQKKKFKKFSFQKILITFPEAKTFLPLLPILQKKEYSSLWKNLLPPHLLQKKKKYLQSFPVNNRLSRFAYYDYQKKEHTKGLPFFFHIEPATSYFLSKSIENPQKYNIAFCFDNEILIIQKYFSDIRYFPNIQNLPSEDFLTTIENFTSIEVQAAYFFLIKGENNANVSSKKTFFFPSFPDAFPNRKIITWQEKIRKNLLPHFFIGGLAVSILFSIFLIFQNFYTIEADRKLVAKLRKFQISQEQIQAQQDLSKEGIKAFQKIILKRLSKDTFVPYDTLEVIEKLPLKEAWLLHFQENSEKILLQVAALEPNFWSNNEKGWKKLLKKDILLQDEQQKDDIYIFFLEIKK
jgi:hypothetical protein